MKRKRSWIQWLGSLELAVFILVALGIISAIGTIVEARFDARTAQKTIYHSTYMYIVLALLVVTLIAVMVDRWPWKKRHASFVCAHIGIILILIGSWVTKEYGVDGVLGVYIGQKDNRVVLTDRQVTVLSSFMDTKPEKIFQEDVEFLSSPPSKEKPFVIKTNQGEVKLVDFMPYVFVDEKLSLSDDPSHKPALRFQLQNDQTHMSQWLHIPMHTDTTRVDLGPAQVILTTKPYVYKSGNQVVFISTKKGLKYQIYSRKKAGLSHQGFIDEGGVAETGWMGFKLRVFNYYPQAYLKKDFQAVKSPVEGISTSAVAVEFKGKTQWVAMDATLRLFSENQVYAFTYGRKKINLPFSIHLSKFEVGRYQGTMRAASYSSQVDVVDRKTNKKVLNNITISMNNPLKHEGMTFYQSSFTENEQGQAEASIFSVNWDPGRFLKYLGSLLVVLGSILLFYFKNLNFKRKQKK